MSSVLQPRTWMSQRKRDDNKVYFPHPAPNSEVDGNEERESKMGATLSFLKTLIIPALISLILFLLVSYILVPAWKRYRARYSQYLPLETISSQTNSFRHRFQAILAKYLLPSSWISDFSNNRYAVSAQDELGGDFDDEDGEELSDVEDNRREALSLDARRGIIHSIDDRRLSRDLEEGFRDDSDEEEAGEQDQRIQTNSR